MKPFLTHKKRRWTEGEEIFVDKGKVKAEHTCMISSSNCNK